jgi:hypothetical protein
MPLPPDISTVVVTGTFSDAAGVPLKGSVTFAPSAVLTDAAGEVVLDGGRACHLQDGSFRTGPLAATDSAGLTPAGWKYLITITLQDAAPLEYTRAIPQSAQPADISSLIAGG